MDLDGEFCLSIILHVSWLPLVRIWAWAPLPSWWNQTSLHILCKHYPLPSLRESSLNPWLSVSSDLLSLNQSVYLKIKSKYLVRQRPAFLFAKHYAIPFQKPFDLIKGKLCININFKEIRLAYTVIQLLI